MQRVIALVQNKLGAADDEQMHVSGQLLRATK